jgi:hypothetical protein
MKPKLIKKAYCIDPASVASYSRQEVDDMFFYGKTEGEAKTEALYHCQTYGVQTPDDDDLSFTTLRLKRSPELDLMEYKGREDKRHIIEYRLRREEVNSVLDKLVSDNPGAFAYIVKGGMYYRDNYAGYTSEKLYAGVYSLSAAVNEVKGISLDDGADVVIIDPETHNKRIRDRVQTLESRLIETNK